MAIKPDLDSIIKNSYILVFNEQVGRGYGTNKEYSKLPSDLGSIGECHDDFWTDTVGPYVLGTLNGVKYKEKIERGAKIDTEKWIMLEEIQAKDSEFSGIIYKEHESRVALIVSHNKLPNSNFYFISQYFFSEKTDEFGRPGTSFVKTILLDEANYRTVLDYIRQNPKNIEDLFGRIAPEIDNKNKLLGEKKKAVLLTVPVYPSL